MATGESTPHDPPARPRAARRRARAARVAKEGTATGVEILKSAAAAFRRLGYHGATVEQIAAALHMKKGNLYYYYRNKEEILYACHQYSLDRLLSQLDEVRSSDATPDEKLRRLIHGAVHTILDELHGTALFMDLEALTPAHLRIVVARRDAFDHGLRQILEEGIASGQFGAADPKLLAFAMLGAVNWIPRWFSPDGAATSQDIAEQFANYLIGGLKPMS